VVAEFSAALSTKLRTRAIKVADRAAAMTMFTRICNENLVVMPLSRAQFRLAARFADQYA
jgi:uncharacterized protein